MRAIKVMTKLIQKPLSFMFLFDIIKSTWLLILEANVSVPIIYLSHLILTSVRKHCYLKFLKVPTHLTYLAIRHYNVGRYFFLLCGGPP